MRREKPVLDIELKNRQLVSETEIIEEFANALKAAKVMGHDVVTIKIKASQKSWLKQGGTE